MRSSLVAVLLLSSLVAGCEDQTVDPGPIVPDNDEAPVAAHHPATTPPADSADHEMEDANDAMLAPPVGIPAVACAKELTVILTVGVPGLSKIKTNGCWKPVITDGAANKTYRKCSTSSFKVTNNPDAANWAYDDTNPTHVSATETSFFNACTKGATGDGYVFMAYNGGWRYLTAPTVKAYFAELYTSALTDIDSHYAESGRYTDNAQIAKHTATYPMMNFGPPASAKLEKKVGSEATKLCATVKTGGYFGLYNASWTDGMEADDPRLLAVEQALNACTAQK